MTDDTAVPPPARDVDDLCAAAVDLARAAAVEVGGGDVGDHLGCRAVESEPGVAVVDHEFACTHEGYRGWAWSVTVARAGTAEPTVDEVALLPGADAVLAPDWVPWSERLRPGDLGPGDMLPAAPGDERLVPALFADADAPLPDGDDPDLAALVAALGLGRARVLSAAGRAEAADRWYAGDGGPEAPIARQAPDRCGTCGFYVQLAGALGRAFGACGNALAPDDGRVVAADHGCGAHSEAAEVPPLAQADAPPPLVDDFRYEYEVSPP